MWEKMKLVMSSMFDFVLPFLRQLMTAAGPALAQAALAAVAVAAASAGGTTSNEKRDMAYRQIANDLKMQGIQVGVDVTTSMINAALEVAYQKTQAK